MGTVPQSAIDSRVGLWLGGVTEQQLNPTIQHMHREDEMSFRVGQLDLSHQNHRTIIAPINLPIGTRNVPMPAGFANPVMVRCNYNVFTNQNQWIPVDIINLDTMPEREMSIYPSIAFWGPGNTAMLSWVPQVAMQLQIFFQPLNLTSKLATAPMPIADLFLGLASASTARRCLPATMISVESKKELKVILDLTLDGPDGKSGWEGLWSKLMNRAPSQGSPRRQSFYPGGFGPGRYGSGLGGI